MRMPLFKISLSSTKRIWLICPKGRIGLKDCLISVIRLVRPQSRTKINVFLCDLMAIKVSWRQMIQHFDSGGLHMSISEIIAVSLQYLLYMIHGILLILLVFAPEVLRWSHRFGLCSRLNLLHYAFALRHLLSRQRTTIPPAKNTRAGITTTTARWPRSGGGLDSTKDLNKLLSGRRCLQPERGRQITTCSWPSASACS